VGVLGLDYSTRLDRSRPSGLESPEQLFESLNLKSIQLC